MLTMNDSHEYFWDDKRVVGVTELLSHFGFINFKNVPEVILSANMDFGSKLHETIKLYMDDNLEECDPVLIPYLENWERFLKEQVEKTRGDIVVDIKTGGEYRWHKYQTALYKILIDNNTICSLNIDFIATRGIMVEYPLYSSAWNFAGTPDFFIKKSRSPIKHRITVYLSKEGYKMRKHTDNSDINAVKSMLTVYSLQKKEGII